jgi:hypothetical protein
MAGTWILGLSGQALASVPVHNQDTFFATKDTKATPSFLRGLKRDRTMSRVHTSSEVLISLALLPAALPLNDNIRVLLEGRYVAEDYIS